MKATDINSGLTCEELKRNLHYNPTTGIFIWKHNPDKLFNSRVGKQAGCARHRTGYQVVQLNGRHYLAHRLAWLYVYGEWPSNHIDHIDGDKKNNRISNFRLASNSQNKSNGKLYKSSTSGLKGASKFRNAWKAQIVHNYKVIYLGLFPTKEQAHEAYLKAASDLQGEFARAA